MLPKLEVNTNKYSPRKIDKNKRNRILSQISEVGHISQSNPTYIFTENDKSFDQDYTDKYQAQLQQLNFRDNQKFLISPNYNYNLGKKNLYNLQELAHGAKLIPEIYQQKDVSTIR